MRSYANWSAIAGSVSLLLLSACGDGGGGSSSSALTASDLAGTYDATVTPPPRGGSGAGVGTVGPTTNGRVAVSIFDRGVTAITTTGTLEDDGSVVLAGQQQSGNIQALVHGSATIREDHDRQIVTGTLELEDGTHAFTLERPVQTRLSRFNGTYTFAFPTSPSRCNCPSTAMIELTVGDEGGGSVLGASDRDASGNEVGSFAGGVALVSSSGRILIKDTYDEMRTPSALWLFGTLTRDGDHVTGAGEFTRQIDPTVTGTWTATR